MHEPCIQDIADDFSINLIHAEAAKGDLTKELLNEDNEDNIDVVEVSCPVVLDITMEDLTTTPSAPSSTTVSDFESELVPTITCCIRSVSLSPSVLRGNTDHAPSVDESNMGVSSALPSLETVGSVNSASMNSESESSDDDVDERANPEMVFNALSILIDQHIKWLRSCKVMQTDSSAGSKVIELEILRQYAGAHLELQRRLQKEKLKIQAAAPHLCNAMHKKIPHCYLQPAQTASNEVAACLGKGPYYARRLRDGVNYLLRTGQVLETKQGQGAAHASLLNCFHI